MPSWTSIPTSSRKTTTTTDMTMATSMSMTSTARSEEHTSELQSPCNLVCRLLLEKKKLNQVDADFAVISLIHAQNLSLVVITRVAGNPVDTVIHRIHLDTHRAVTNTAQSHLRPK